jgi:2-oxoglutarate dehydrogenase E2 component (dihydrolipoamide succinyltransferase)
MKVDVIMPQMGESIAEGTVLRYLKKVGEAVGRDEDILEISTDKVDATVPSPASGVLAEILVPEGETVEVNAVLARIETEAGAAVDAGAPPAEEAAPKPAAPVAPAPPGQAAPDAAAAPALGPAAGAAAPGAGSAAGAPVSAPSPGAASEAPAPCAVPTEAGPPFGRDLTAARRAGRVPSKEELRRVRSTPLVRRMAREHGIDISRIQGTGLSGRVTRKDIMAYVESGGSAAAVAAAPAASAPVASASTAVAAAATPAAAVPVAPPIAFAPGEAVHVEPMTQMRRKIAEHMVASRQTSAHVHTVFEIDMTAVEALRARHKARWEEREGIKLTYTPFILKAAIESLKAFPIVNASVDGDKILYHKNVNLGVAVAWPARSRILRRARAPGSSSRMRCKRARSP